MNVHGRALRPIVLASTFFLTACVTPPMWSKAGATEADFNAQAYECEKDARLSAGSFGGGIVATLEFQNFERRCMVAHGWMIVERM